MRELNFIRAYDAAYTDIDLEFDLSNGTSDLRTLWIRQQNNGRMPRRRLTAPAVVSVRPDQIEQMEAIAAGRPGHGTDQAFRIDRTRAAHKTMESSVQAEGTTCRRAQGDMTVNVTLEMGAQFAEGCQPGVYALDDPAMAIKSVVALNAFASDAVLDTTALEVRAASRVTKQIFAREPWQDLTHLQVSRGMAFYPV